jgi:hypothetical protein
MRRLWAAGAAMFVCLALGGLPALAQDASPAPGVIQRDVLFDVTVPVDVMPDELTKINLERQTIAPGMAGIIDAGNEAIRGRVLMVDAGELVITPMADAWVWQADDSTGGTGTVAAAGEPVALATGDILLIPAIPPDELDPAGVVGIANPGDVETVILGFHMHQSGGAFPGWPTGMSGVGSPTVSTAAAMDAVSAGDTAFRMTRLTAQPGATITPPDDALFTFYRVEEGTLEQTTTGPGGTFTGRLVPGLGATMEVLPDVERSLTVIGDKPAVLLELAVTPSVEMVAPGASAPTAAEAPTAYPVIVTGTEACGARPYATVSNLPGIESGRDGVAECVNTMSDPRVDGTYINTLNYDCYSSGMCLMWGTHVLDGPDGGWDCSWAGAYYPASPDGFLVSGVCPGTGGFEGLTYVFQHGNAGFDGATPFADENTFDGFIYEGPAPTIFAMQSEPGK